VKINRKAPTDKARYADALARKRRHKRNTRKISKQEKAMAEKWALIRQWKVLP
jgi:hypothetical protein